MRRTEYGALHLPDSALRHCIFMAVERDTRGVDLAPQERFNYYPASPFPTISWVFEGELRLVLDPPGTKAPEFGPPIPDLAFAGPYDRPVASWSPGPIHALTVSFYPEFITRVAAIDLSAWINRISPLGTVVGTRAVPMFDACWNMHGGPGPAFPRLEQELLAWRDTPAGAAACRTSFASWLTSLAMQVAYTRTGAGIRRFQRRMRALAGQSERDLRLYVRTEEAFVRYAKEVGTEQLDWASLAQSAGFADQSHMGREVKRVTGYSPAQLHRLMEDEEPFWFYRLIHGHHARSS